MSKAFTREDDERESDVSFVRASAGQNYLTADGAARLTAELNQLEDERRQLLASGEESAAEKARAIEAGIRRISQVLSTATVLSPPTEATAEIRFGAFVTVRDETSAEDEYRIVGPEEVDLERNWISPVTPIARALLGRHAGETVQLKTAGGERVLKVIHVSYAPAG
jgi:transcription elongation GreA/GreB family factor